MVINLIFNIRKHSLEQTARKWDKIILINDGDDYIGNSRPTSMI